MERYYYINLLFKNNQIYDTEHGRWRIIGIDNINPLENYLDFSNDTMLVKHNGCYIINDNHIDLSNEKKYTLSLKYRIDEEYMKQAIENENDIYSLHWGSGYIKILEFVNHISYLRVNLDGYDFYIKMDYIKNYNWNHLLITCDKDMVSIYYNGKKKKEYKFTSPSYTFDFLELGNYTNTNINSIVEYNELVIVNDCLYDRDFIVSDHPLHLLFPEVVYENPIIITNYPKVAAPRLFSSKNSHNDIIHNIDIMRHVDYKIDRSKQVSKYKFE